MTETPTETADRSGGFHLPVLPKGWKYGIYATGPDGQSITVSHDELRDSPRVHVTTGRDGDHKAFEVASLGDGVKQAVGIARTLRDLAEHEKKSAAAREAFLSQIGRPSPRREDGELDTPASLSEATDPADA